MSVELCLISFCFIAWWMFIISLALTSALAFSSSASNPAASPGVPLEEVLARDSGTINSVGKRRLSVFMVSASLMAVVGGFATLCCGVTTYNLHGELKGEAPHISAGPDLGPKGIQPAPRSVSYVIIVLFALCMFGGHVYRLRLMYFARPLKQPSYDNAA